MSDRFEQFDTAFGIWEEVRPHLALIVEPAEMALVVALRGERVTVAQAADRLGISPDGAASVLERAYARCILDKSADDDGVLYWATDLYARLDHFAKFENWDEIPAADRRSIDRRFLSEFIARHRDAIDRKKQGLTAQSALPNDTVLLLPEVEEMLDAARLIAVQPCDCRRLGQFCGRPVETCIALDETAVKLLDRGQGRRLTTEEAKELVRWADRKGLMHTGDSEWRTRGLHAICNCCACDCYPFRAGQLLDTKGLWPRSRHVAVRRGDECNQCGACIKRCHFSAFYEDGSVLVVNGQAKPAVHYDATRCWGCGLCANTCPTGAIRMTRIE